MRSKLPITPFLVTNPRTKDNFRLGSLESPTVRMHTKWLRLGLSVVIVLLAIEMLYNGLSGRI